MSEERNKAAVNHRRQNRDALLHSICKELYEKFQKNDYRKPYGYVSKTVSDT